MAEAQVENPNQVDKSLSDNVGPDINHVELGEAGTLSPNCRSIDETSPFRIVREESLMHEMSLEILEAAELTCLPPSSIRIMLNLFKWDKNNMLKQTMYGELLLHLRDIGLIINPVNHQPEYFPAVPHYEMMKHGVGNCLTCQRTTKVQQLVFTACGHWFCVRCFQKHLIQEIEIGDMSQFKCPFSQCLMILDDNIVTRNLQAAYLDRFKERCLEDFVRCSKYRQFCPNKKKSSTNVSCRRSCYLDVDTCSTNTEIECDCGLNYCFNCGQTWHYPLSCYQLKKWLQLFRIVPEYSKFLDFKYTLNLREKPCPCCSVLLKNYYEKDIIICVVCNFEFCWRCLGKIEKESNPNLDASRHTCLSKVELQPNVAPDHTALMIIYAEYAKLVETKPTCSNTGSKASLGSGVVFNNPKAKRIGSMWETVEKSKLFIRHAFAFAYFLESSSYKLQYMKQLFAFDDALEQMVTHMAGEDQFVLYSAVEDDEATMRMERAHLQYILKKGFENSWWTFKNTKWSALCENCEGVEFIDRRLHRS